MGLSTHIMAIERVQQILRKVSAALDAAAIRYAVVGGNAVAAWVGRVDSGAAHGVPAEPIRTDEYAGQRFMFIRDPDDLPIESYEAAAT